MLLLNNYQCYQVLGLQEGASFKEIKSAYRNLVLKCHPDKNNSNYDDKKFKLITEAYHILKSGYKRNMGVSTNQKKYDDINSNKKYDFSRRKNSWGARYSDNTTQEDWNKHAKYTENAYQDFWKFYEKTFWEYYEKIRAEKKEQSESIQIEEEIQVSVKVDPERCIACCSCETIAPKVFHVEKNVRVNPKSRVINEMGAKTSKIFDAAHTCPTKAISVTNKENHQRLYPY